MEIVEPAEWIVIHDCPKWLIPFSYYRHTKVWLHPDSAILEIEARSMVDCQQVEDLAAILPVVEWDADLLEGYGLTEPLFDLERMYLSPEWRLKSHEFLIDLRENPAARFYLRMVWGLELETASELLPTLQTIHLSLRREYHGCKK